jgi:hypothetical protein
MHPTRKHIKQHQTQGFIVATRRSARILLRSVMLLCGLWGGLCGGAVLAFGPARRSLTGLLGPLSDHGPGAVRDVPFEVVVTGLCALAVLCCLAWAVLVVSLAVLEGVAAAVGPHVSSGPAAGPTLTRLSSACCPLVVRTLVAALVGAAVTAGAAGAASADVTGTGTTASAPSTLTGLPLPDRVPGHGRSWAPEHPSAADGDRTVLVGRGDSLWRIAARRLAPDAAPAAVAVACHRLYAANAGRIGPDPDLIHPGTALVVPDPPQPDREERP